MKDYVFKNKEVDEIKIISDRLKKKLKLLSCFDIAHVAWECDSIGYIVEEEDTKKRHIILTSHGAPYIAKVEELHEILEEYERLEYETKEAIDSFMGETK